MLVQPYMCPGRLLIVDDDICVVNSLARLLRSSCSEIFTATNGEDALTILEHREVDVIVSDALLPPFTGIALFRKAKSAFPELKTIMLTGKSDLSDIFQAKRECVINTFLSKPWDDREIVATIRESFALLMPVAPGQMWRSSLDRMRDNFFPVASGGVRSSSGSSRKNP